MKLPLPPLAEVMLMVRLSATRLTDPSLVLPPCVVSLPLQLLFLTVDESCASGCPCALELPGVFPPPVPVVSDASQAGKMCLLLLRGERPFLWG